MPALICSNSNYPDATTSNVTLQQSSISKAAHKVEDSLKQLSSPAWSEGSCRVWMWGLEVTFVSLLFILMGLQATLGVKLYGYAAWLARRKTTERIERELC
jgi:hypothetical protein